jgi:hypothetical protein
MSWCFIHLSIFVKRNVFLALVTKITDGRDAASALRNHVRVAVRRQVLFAGNTRSVPKRERAAREVQMISSPTPGNCGITWTSIAVALFSWTLKGNGLQKKTAY